MHAVWALTASPRAIAKLNACELNWRNGWRRTLVVLRGGQICLRDLVAVGTALGKCGFPLPISELVLTFLTHWPQAIADDPGRSTRRKKRLKSAGL